MRQLTNKKISKLNISIGITAFNEEDTIGRLLHSISGQREQSICIKEILLILDGCTDKTEKKIREIGNKRTKIIIGRRRKGKTARLNQLFSRFIGDILVLVDADIFLKNRNTLEEITKPFRNKKIGLVSSRADPLEGRTFIEKAIYISTKPYLEYAETTNKGRNIYACKGVLLALSGKFAKSVKIPNDVFANDTYLYFDALTKGYDFAYTKSSEVSYKLPSTIKDHLRQNERFEGAQFKIKYLFGALVDKEFRKYNTRLYFLMFKQFLKHPIYSLSIFLINLYTKYNAKIRAESIKPQWEIASSTKTQVNIS